MSGRQEVQAGSIHQAASKKRCQHGQLQREKGNVAHMKQIGVAARPVPHEWRRTCGASRELLTIVGHTLQDQHASPRR
jgi:hypothetical protein